MTICLCWSFLNQHTQASRVATRGTLCPSRVIYLFKDHLFVCHIWSTDCHVIFTRNKCYRDTVWTLVANALFLMHHLTHSCRPPKWCWTELSPPATFLCHTTTVNDFKFLFYYANFCCFKTALILSNFITTSWVIEYILTNEMT